MKTLKKANQKNVGINQGYYNISELREMLNDGTIFYIKEWSERTSEYDFTGHDYREYEAGDPERDLRIECDDAELKVICDEYGYYTNVLVKNGTQYYIILQCLEALA